MLKTVSAHYLSNVVTVDGRERKFAPTVLTSYPHGIIHPLSIGPAVRPSLFVAYVCYICIELVTKFMADWMWFEIPDDAVSSRAS